MKDKDKLFYILLIVLALAVNLSGINVKFFTDDPGLYASIAKDLFYKHNFFELYCYNRDWLDKPHFPFWAILLSYKIFGVSVWSYRLPALFFFCLSLLYTYFFTRKYHGWEIAAMAVLILMTAQHVIMSNTDVRAEPYLMALIIAAIYHISELEEKFTVTDLLLASSFTACAIMTKGIFVVTAIYGSLLGQLILQKKFRHLLHYKWLLLIGITVVFTLPELYALYIQFDLHPEKTVFGRHNVSGIKWFLWDSQFGRFVNTGPIIRKDGGSIFFYLHTLLWAFAPWCLMFYYAVYKNLHDIFNNRKLVEYYALSGGLLLLLLFSLSGFQLPFYTNSVFPLFAIVTAPWCYARLSSFGTKFRLASQWVFIIIFPVAILIANFYLKPARMTFFGIDCFVFGTVIYFIFSEITKGYKQIFLLNCAAVLFANFYINTTLYPELAATKGQIMAADYANQDKFKDYNLYSYNNSNNIFQFYCNRQVYCVAYEPAAGYQHNALIYVTHDDMGELKKRHARFTMISSFINYPTEQISTDFIDKNNRNTVLDSVYLVTDLKE